jgi:hypothetical protein
MKLISLALVAAFAVAGSAQAQAPSQGQTLSPDQHARAEACKDEMKSLCAGKQGQEATQCLQANSSKLSPKCKESVSK